MPDTAAPATARYRHTFPARRWEEHPEDLIMSFSLLRWIQSSHQSPPRPLHRNFNFRSALESRICQCASIAKVVHDQTATKLLIPVPLSS
jgi:hypothetical protein